MRICVYHNLPSGGAKRALYEWVRRLASRHRLHVFSLSTANHDYCDIRPFVERYDIYEFSPHQLLPRPLGRLNHLQRWRDLGALERIGRSIVRAIDDRGYDVLFAHPCLYTTIPILLQFAALPAVYYLHEPFGPGLTREFERPYLGGATWRRWSRRLDPFAAAYRSRCEHLQARSVARVTLFLANSEFTREQMLCSYGLEAPVCHYGVDTEAFRPMPDVPKSTHVVSVGELTPRKGFDFLVRSLGEIPVTRRPALRLVCNVENPDERQYVETLAREHGVKLDVRLNLSTDEVAQEYNRAALCVYAPVLEPLGLVPLESMACGTPVLAVREAGVRETVVHGETGWLVERDSHEFAEALTMLLRDHDLRQSLGARGPAYVREHWSWDSSVACIEWYLTQVAAGTLGSPTSSGPAPTSDA